MKMSVRAALAACVLFTAAPASAVEQLAVGLTTGSTFVRGTFQNWGWSFDLGWSRKLTGLALYDTGGDGLLEVHPVGVWDSNGILVAYAEVSNDDPFVAGQPNNRWRLQTIAPVVLTAGRYVIGAHYTLQNGGDFFVGQSDVFSVDPAVTYVNSRVTLGVVDGFAEPTTESFFGAEGYFGPNALLASVPEPSTWAIMVGGLGAVGAALRRRRPLIPA